MLETEKNLELWDDVCFPDPAYTKKVNKGYECTETNPTYNIMRMTEKFGPMGGKWGVKDEIFSYIGEGKGLHCIYNAKLFYVLQVDNTTEKTCIIEMHADTKVYELSGKINNDFTKKVATEAMSKALSKLGFSASIYMNEYGSLQEEQAANNEKEQAKKKNEDEKEQAEKTALKKFYAGVESAETQEKLDVVKDWMEKSPFKNKEELREALSEKSKKFEAQA